MAVWAVCPHVQFYVLTLSQIHSFGVLIICVGGLPPRQCIVDEVYVWAVCPHDNASSITSIEGHFFICQVCRGCFGKGTLIARCHWTPSSVADLDGRPPLQTTVAFLMGTINIINNWSEMVSFGYACTSVGADDIWICVML